MPKSEFRPLAQAYSAPLRQEQDPLAIRSGYSGFDQPQKLARIIREAGEDAAQAAFAQMPLHDLAQHAAIIRGYGQIAVLIELALVHAGPARIDLPAFHAAAHHKHAVCVPVVSAAIAILMRGAAKFGHADEYDVTHPVAHILMKRRNPLPQVSQQIRELALHSALIDVMIPTAAIKERNLEAHVRLE